MPGTNREAFPLWRKPYNVLLAFPAVEGLALRPDGFEEVQNALRQEESQEILVKLELRDGFVHSVCGRFT